MHILSGDNRSEFLACPQLVKLDYARGKYGFEPTLLIKGSTLLLKSILSGADLKFVVTRIDDRLLYGLLIKDDPIHPAVLWSVVEKNEELKALNELCNAGQYPTFLFNELAVNVAWTNLPIELSSERLKEINSGLMLGRANYTPINPRANAAFNYLFAGQTDSFIESNIDGTSDWNKVNNILITNKAKRSQIDAFATNEGDQQEELAIWIVDNLHPQGAYHQPQIPDGPRKRELTDLLLTYDLGTFLIESKALELKSRDKLASAITKHVEKALRQLKGSIRKIKDNIEVTTRSGDAIDIERKNPIHAIVLVPDLDLLDDETCSIDRAIQFMEKTGGFLHFLDVAELLRVVQAAEMISAAGKKTTSMMAFDYYLIERAKKAVESGTMKFSMLFRMEKP